MILGGCMLLGLCGCDDATADKITQQIARTVVDEHRKSQKPKLTPKATVQYFLLRCQAGDGKGAVQYFCWEFRQKAKTDELTDWGFKVMFQNSRIIDVEENDDTAIVYVRVQNPITEEWSTIPIPLIIEDGQWRISLDLANGGTNRPVRTPAKSEDEETLKLFDY